MSQKHRPSGTPAGFTLVEMMVVISVAIILVGLGAPSFANVLRQNRITAAVNDVIAGFQLARSEAAKRGVPVRLCPAEGPNPDSCSGTDWATGAIAFVDLNGDGTRDTNSGSGEDTLYVRSSLGANIFVNVSTPLRDGLTFSGDGFPRDLLNDAQMVFCDEPDDQTRRRIVSVSTTGRPAAGRSLTIEGGLECR
ncbi:MAG: GspH/FimT family pseudopilin [Pseudomonadota bacterium]